MFNSITGLGKYLFAIPFLVFGIGHFMGGDKMAGMVPIPGGVLWVYFTGIAMLAFGVSILIGKYDKLGAILIALMLLIFIVFLHLPHFNMDNMSGLFKDLGLMGACLMYADRFAQDKSVVG